jgi:tRNA dimethylallyltransferase
MSRRPPLALVGPTAVGKTGVSLAVAEATGAEIVSIDSMLVYRGMDIGTAKPTLDERGRVPHHMIDVAEPSEPFSVARFQGAAREAVARIGERRRVALLVGGSGLYLRAVVDDLEFPGTDPATRSELERQARVLGPEHMYERLAATDPVAAARIDPGNVRRTVRALEVPAITGREFSSFTRAWERYDPEAVRTVGLRMPRETLVARIGARARSMLDSGWLDEVRGLMDRGFGGWLTSTQAIGYAELARHLRGEMSLDAALEAIVTRTGHLARRQMSWFRRDPRIRWFDVNGRGAMRALEPILAAFSGPWGDD